MEKTLMKWVFVLCCCQQIVSREVDWCSLSCADGTKNTMCMYQPTQNAGECKNIEMITTPQARKKVLEKHNDLRNSVASGTNKPKFRNLPPAGNMRQMSWDDNLERLAYRWAQQCPIPSGSELFEKHDDCRRTPVFENVGQNTGFAPGLSATATADNVPNSWMLIFMISKVEPEQFIDEPPPEMMPFAQMLNAGTYKIGCSIVEAEANIPLPDFSLPDMAGLPDIPDSARNTSKRKKISTRTETETSIMVCNYGPGIKKGEPIYDRKASAACETCPPDTKCYEDSAYKYLCALESDDRYPKDIPDPPGINGSGRPKMKLLDSHFSTISFAGILSSLVHKMSK